ncbi:hypothetical protein K493DRAFT_306852 [Basidiobolus meristosporus CBS 931.73]|uniref:Uncharacterized protein n=1 Tax=Basidiobolus meristosporus CBS 931.73 TaxID=1314790 RepID=A0A1Y1XPF5_9FUNG|nr:hypothetical protein K493DRAFT_306852 [Basidiobolus meristosporus CBS 931.73]|eukprot:ORX87629.1 hypothetical protein K493DRAFT_306852 [Basidiobolus meristosporus CBS 931.73]
MVTCISEFGIYSSHLSSQLLRSSQLYLVALVYSTVPRLPDSKSLSTTSFADKLSDIHLPIQRTYSHMTVLTAAPSKKRGADTLCSPLRKKPSFFVSLFQRASREFTELCSSISSVLYDPHTQQAALIQSQSKRSSVRRKQRRSRSPKESRKIATPVTRRRSARFNRPSPKDTNTTPGNLDGSPLTELILSDAGNSPSEWLLYSSTPQCSPKYKTIPVVLIPVKSDPRRSSRNRSKTCKHSPAIGTVKDSVPGDRNMPAGVTDGIHIHSSPSSTGYPAGVHQSLNSSLGLDTSLCSPSSNDVSSISANCAHRKSNSARNGAASTSPSKIGKIARLEEELQALKVQVASLRQVVNEKKQNGDSSLPSPVSESESSTFSPPLPLLPPLPPVAQSNSKSLDGSPKQAKAGPTSSDSDRMTKMLEEMRTVKLRKTGRL